MRMVLQDSRAVRFEARYLELSEDAVVDGSGDRDIESLRESGILRS
jgi:hypothetical protein